LAQVSENHQTTRDNLLWLKGCESHHKILWNQFSIVEIGVICLSGGTSPLSIVDCTSRMPNEELRLIPNVDDPEADALEGINEVEINAWKKKVLKSRILLSTIDPNLLNTLLGCKTENEIRVRLTSKHLKNAAENKYVAMQRFYDYKFQAGHDAIRHISAIDNPAEQLSNIGQPISEAQLITKIICTIPPSYRGFLPAWDNVVEEINTVTLLSARILKEESMAAICNMVKPIRKIQNSLQLVHLNIRQLVVVGILRENQEEVLVQEEATITNYHHLSQN
jgi:hypothetical protein